MKFFFLILLLLSGTFIGSTQSILFDNIWVTGFNLIKFNGTQKPTTDTFITTNSIIHPFFSKGSSNICDSNGNLLVATTGGTLFDKHKNKLENGDSLIPNSIYNYYGGGILGYSQNSLFLPFPQNKFYLFTPTVSDSLFSIAPYYDMLTYHIIDMNANAGAGKVIQKSVSLLKNAKLNRTNMMACKHGDGSNWWLLKQGHDSNYVYTFLVTADSIYDYGTQSFPLLKFGRMGWCDWSGQAMFNKQGTQYAACVRGAGYEYDTMQGVSGYPDPPLPGKFFVANFDRCSGQLSNPKVFITPPSPCQDPMSPPACLENMTQGLCFSPNGRFLYVTSYNSIKQLDLWDNNTSTQWSYIAGMDTTFAAFQTYGSMYLGPDGRIYVGYWNGLANSMSAILYPDNKGAACGWSPKYLQFLNLGVSAPPSMPNYRLGNMPGCATVGNIDITKNNEVWSVYPNPSNTKFKILNTKSEKSKKELYNSIGQLILSTKENEIDVSSLSKGVYYIKLGNESKKVVVE